MRGRGNPGIGGGLSRRGRRHSGPRQTFSLERRRGVEGVALFLKRVFLVASWGRFELCRSRRGRGPPGAVGAGELRNVVSSLVSVHQPAMRSHLSAELHRVPMPAVPFAAGGAARHGGAGRPRRGGVDEALRGALQEQRVALRLRRLGQEGVDSAADQRRQRRVALRRRDEPVLGRALRQGHRGGGPVDQALRQHAQRVVQGPRHDGAGLAGQTDDLGGRADQGGGVRLDGRHLGGAGDVLRRRRHPIRRAAAAGQDLHRAVDPAGFQRRPGALPGHRLRRLHEAGAGDHQGPDAVPGQLDELAARGRPEDRGHRDRPAIRLGSARRDHHPRAATWATSPRSAKGC